MISIDELAARVRANFPNADLDVLRRAYELSVREHQGQRRQSGEPYVSHPIEVAQILCDLHLDMACICAGLLHDVVEDAGTPIELIRDSFGDEIAHMVAGVTKLSRMQYSSQKERQAESFRRLLLAVVDDLRVLLVKLADRLHNMRTLEHLPLEKGRAIAQETLEIYAPIAHRLGMSRIRGELEDLAFKYVDPAAYRSLEGQLARKKASTDKSTREVIRTLEDRLKEEGIEARIETRVKRVHSTYEKLRTRKLSLDQVFDFIALRVLVASERDCYVVLGVVNNMWKPVPGRIKDFIAMPRANMYQSIHTTVLGPDGHPFEVQIRTAAMHRVAEEGIAAHWKYKEGKVAQEKDDKRFGWLRQLLEWNREVSDPHQFLSNLKIDLYPEEVYVFTPKREVVALPRGATPVDFAYAIHTEVGHRCVGAKVNGRIVPLKHRLVNGEIVEILTAGDANPSKDWLNFVRTARARNAIRRSINLRLREEAVEVGRRLLEKEARRFQLNLKKYQDKLETVPATFGRSKLEELYADVGYGKVPARRILQCLAPELRKLFRIS
jgi:GTP pyrophosphokinase